MTEEDEESDDEDSDDEVEEKVRKETKKTAKKAHKTCFAFIDKKHWLYVDIIASKLGRGNEAQKTLHEIFQLDEEDNVAAFRKEYNLQMASINEAVEQQQKKDCKDSMTFLQDQELFGDVEWFKERKWLPPDELVQLQNDSGDIQRDFGYVAKTLRCYLPLHQERYRHPVNADFNGKRDVLREESTGLPKLKYLDFATTTLFSFATSAEEDNQEMGVFWSDRPIGISDEEWQTRMKDLRNQKQVDLQEKQKAAIAALPSDQHAAAFQRTAERLKDEAERQRVHEEGTQNLEVRINALKENRSEIHPRLETVPDGVRTAQREIIPYIQYWWAHDENELDDQRFTRANTRIRAATNETRFLLTYTELLPAIKTFRTLLSQSEGTAVGSSTSGQPSHSISDLMGDAISLTNLLRRFGIDWKMVVTKDIHERFFRLLYSSNDDSVTQAREKFEQSWLEMYESQRSALESARLVASTYKIITESLTMPLEDALRVLIEQYSTLNVSLKSTNDLLGLPSADHSIPVAELQAALRNRDSEENRDYCLAVFLYKITMLQIPGHDIMKEIFKVSLTTEQEMDVRRQVLGLATASLPGDIDAHSLYPTMSSTSLASRYASCSVQVTEMWGGATAGRRFYINRYGPETSPIHRIERQPVAGHSWGHVGLPLPFQIGCEDNKFGHIKKYGTEHIAGIAGVAWSEDVDMTHYPNAVEYLNPIYHDSSSEHYVDKWKATYVLVKWDRFLLGKTMDSALVAYEFRWETRSELRKRWHGADRKIYEFAKQRQEEFDAWQNGQPIDTSRQVSPQLPIQSVEKRTPQLEQSVAPAQTRNIASLAASYRTAPSPMLLQQQGDRTNELPDRSGPKNGHTLRLRTPDSSYGSRSGSQETDAVDRSIRPSVEGEDAIEVEKVWSDLQSKYCNDYRKQRDAMNMVFIGHDWLSILKKSFATS